MKVLKESIEVMKRGRKIDYLYTLKEDPITSILEVVKNIELSMPQICHKRMRNIIQRGPHELNKQRVFGEILLKELGFCQHYN